MKRSYEGWRSTFSYLIDSTSTAGLVKQEIREKQEPEEEDAVQSRDEARALTSSVQRVSWMWERSLQRKRQPVFKMPRRLRCPLCLQASYLPSSPAWRQ